MKFTHNLSLVSLL